MIELVNTSLPNGLLPGTHGFATVGMTRGTPDNIRTLLEGLSSYAHRASGHDARYWTDNPVAWHHVAPPGGGHVLSRVAACEFDYTGRTNRLARHWQAAEGEWPAGCNAAAVLLGAREWFEAPWTCDAKWLEAGSTSRLASAGMGGGEARHWVALYGEKGHTWARKVAAELNRNLSAGAGKTLVAVTTPAWDPDGTKLLGLFADLIDLLPARIRGKATFSTYSAVLPGWVPCALRGMLPDDSALGVLTGGRPWFDAVSGVLHREELLPTEMPAETAIPAASRPTGQPLSSPLPPSSSAPLPGRASSVGAGANGIPSLSSRKAKASGVWYFAVLVAVLLCSLGFLLFTMLADRTPPLPQPESEAPPPPPAEDTDTEVAEPDEKGEECPKSEVEAHEKEIETAPQSAPAETESPPEPARLLEGGAVWRDDRPRPDEGEVTWWYYPPDGNIIVSERRQPVEAAGVRSWGQIDPPDRFVRLWQDSKNCVYWEWAKPPTNEVPSNGPAELDWRPLLLGPDERVWQEWEAQASGRTAKVQFNVEVDLQEAPYDFKRKWTVDARGGEPMQVNLLWDDAWQEALSHWKSEDAPKLDSHKRLEEEIAELKNAPDPVQTEREAANKAEEDARNNVCEQLEKYHQMQNGQLRKFISQHSNTNNPRAGKMRHELGKVEKLLHGLKKKNDKCAPEVVEKFVDESSMTVEEKNVLKGQINEWKSSLANKSISKDPQHQEQLKEQQKNKLEEKEAALATLPPLLVSEEGQEEKARSLLLEKGRMRVRIEVK